MSRLTTNVRGNSRKFGVVALLAFGAMELLSATRMDASVPTRHPRSFTSIAAAPQGGFWVQLTDTQGGGTRAINGAPQYESVPGAGTITAIPGENGYWVVTTNGKIYARGGARQFCDGDLKSCSGWDGGLNNKQITGAAAAPNGQGLWAVDNQGQVWTAGEVSSYGDVTKDNATPTFLVATPSGKGYYILMDDGGVFSFGDAVFFGSTGGKKPGGHTLTGMALSHDLQGRVNGYWLLADDGAIYTYGDAPFLGNGGVYPYWGSGLTTRPDGHSYAWVFADGQVGLSQKLPEIEIISEKWGWVWGVPRAPQQPKDPILSMSPANTPLQHWLLWPTTVDGSIVQIVNVTTGLCADVAQLNQPPWTIELIQFTCKGKDQAWDNQRFQIVRNGEGHAQLLPVSPAKTVVYGPRMLGTQLTALPYQDGWAAGWLLSTVPGSDAEPEGAESATTEPPESPR